MSRLIVKNLPKHLNDVRFRKHFEQKGEVTDAKIVYTSDKQSRRFGFIGYKSESEAKAAVKYFNNTFIDTSRIQVSIADTKGNETNRPWSKYSEGSSAYEKKHGVVDSSKKSENQSEVADDKSNANSNGTTKKGGDALRDFVTASKSKKRKAWENDLELQTDDNESTIDNNSNQQQKKKTKKELKEEKKRLKKEKKKSKKEGKKSDKMDEDNENSNNSDDKNEEDDDIVHDETISDMDYLKARMKANFDEELNEKESENDKKEDDEEASNDKSKSNEIAANANNARLYIRNLPFTTMENELSEYYSQFGTLAEVHLPIDIHQKKPKGFAFVTFMEPLHAAQAQQNTDGQVFQGRVLHVMFAKPPPSKDNDNNDSSAPGSHAAKRDARKAAESSNAGVWANLFVDAAAAGDAAAKRLGVDKHAFLNETDAGTAAVRLALGETEIIAETKAYFENEGVCLNPPPGEVKRSSTAMIVKNLSSDADQTKLQSLFAKHGALDRFLMPPSRLFALVEYDEPNHAKTAFKHLSFARFGSQPLYLEWAPVGLLNEKTSKKGAVQQQQAEEKQTKPKETTTSNDVDDVQATATDESESTSRTLFISNLSFETEQKALQKLCKKKLGRESGLLSVTLGRDAMNQRNAGYGFVEFKTRDNALKAFRKLNQVELDGRVIEVELAKPKEKAITINRKETNSDIKTPKLMIRNIAFQASEKELKELFGAFGDIKKLRMPKKFDGSSRGFAFVTYETTKIARAAATALKHTHFYGRHLVIEQAKD